MSSFSPLLAPDHRLAQQAREQFVRALEPLFAELLGPVQQRLAGFAQSGSGASVSELHLAMEASTRFAAQGPRWAAMAVQDWRLALDGAAASMPSGTATQSGRLELLDDEVVEQEIIASRLALGVQERAHWELNDLRLRIQRLEGTRELAAADVFRPEVLARLLIQAWTKCGLTREMWALVHESIRALVAHRMAQAYQEVNAFLIAGGVGEIDLKAMVRRADDGGGAASVPGGRGDTRADGPAESRERLQDDHAAVTRVAGMSTFRGSDSMAPSVLARAGQATREMPAGTPLARARQRAWDVLGQVRRLLADRGAQEGEATSNPSWTGAAEHTLAPSHMTATPSQLQPAPSLAGRPPEPPSPALARALLEPRDPFAPTQEMRPGGEPVTMVMPVTVEVAASRLWSRATELKAKAEKPSEKAIIEIVALMFQAILAEERIPATVRVWFARLQIPVLRLALAEPDFFASAEHPARQLIDRMGACALGFDAGDIAGSQLEREIKRIVQVIEQYPETGRRVYQLVFEEFKKFLGRSLTRGGPTQQVATLAQQVEQKEALSIQYTIELRKMLSSVPVREEIREFLFRIWAEVLALAAVRLGPQHEQTLRYKQAAADLLWSVSAKTSRAERTQVVQQLPGLLHTLREGMNTLAMAVDAQEQHIKLVNDAVTQAFVSRGEGISAEMLQELVQGLAGLEDVVTNDAEGDVLLDPGMIEMMSGVDSAALEVIASGGATPGAAVLSWAQELDLGAWFVLERSGSVVQVQYVWRSQRGQLHLFASSAGKSYLVQTRRLASYLQAGLLVPVEDDALTVRATREALARLGTPG